MASQQLVRWFGQEREPLRSEGIDDADPRVVMDAVTRRHLAEIKSDPALQSSKREAHYPKAACGQCLPGSLARPGNRFQ